MLLKILPSQLLQRNAFDFIKKQVIRNKSNFGHHGKKVAVIGAPFNKGQRKDGVQHGPSALRSSGFMKDLEDLGYSVKDYGDIQVADEPEDPPIGKLRNARSVGKICKKVFDVVSEIVANGTTCITLGGDHSLAIGTVLGHARVNPDLCLLWIDAHSDINTTRTTLSGNLHGVAASYLFPELHAYNDKLPGLEWAKPTLSVRDMVYIGLRDVDPLERVILQKFGVLAYSMREVDQFGITEVISHALQAVNPNLDRPIHVTFDIDVLDTTVAPNTGTAVPGGLTLREGLYVAEEIYATGQLAALDLVEVNPVIGTTEDCDKTILAARLMLGAFFGSYRGGNWPLDVTELPHPDPK